MKVHNTRRQRAIRLMELLHKGPQLTDLWTRAFTPEEAQRQVKGWLESWVSPLVEELVPELRKK